MLDETLVKNRKKEAARLQRALFSKLSKVQKLVIKRVLKGDDIVFNISSFAGIASLISIDDIDTGHKYYSAKLKHYDFMDFEYDNCVCEFYEEQHRVIDYWIELLKKESK